MLGSYRVLSDAFDTDVRPLLSQVRSEMGVPEDPIEALADSPYPAQVVAERGRGDGGSGGYPGA